MNRQEIIALLDQDARQRMCGVLARHSSGSRRLTTTEASAALLEDLELYALKRQHAPFMQYARLEQRS